MTILNMVTKGSWWWGWANIWEPTNIQIPTFTNSSATVQWTDGVDMNTIPSTTFQKAELVRKIGSAPTSPSDWTLVTTETVRDTYSSNGYPDSWLTEWTEYYYQVYCYSDLWWITYWTPTSIIPHNTWTPWANTYAYYPLTSDANDIVNNRNMTAYSGITYSSDWALLPNSNASTWLLEPFNVTSSGTWTFSFRWKALGASPWWYDGRLIDCFLDWSNRIFSMWSSNSQIISVAGTSVTVTENVDVWYHHVVTISNWAVNVYLDGNQTPILTKNVTTGLTSTFFRRWQEYNNNFPRQFYGNLKDVIIESVAWSAQDVSDYYDIMKWEYGKN